MKYWLLILLIFTCTSLHAQKKAGGDPLDDNSLGDADLKEMEKMEDLELKELEKQITDSQPPMQAVPKASAQKAAPAAKPKAATAPQKPKPEPIAPLEPSATPEPQLAKPEPELDLFAPETPPPQVIPEPAPAPTPEPVAPPPQVVEAAPTPTEVPDEPNAEFEKRMAMIYEDFFKTRTADSEWQRVIGDRSQETYVVQSGDTLWDLSEVLFGNGHFWTKLWAENRNFTNPHSIEINDKILFVGGELAAEPQIHVTGIENEDDETPEPSVPFQADVDLPRASKGKYLRQVPPSLPENTLEFGKYDNQGFELKRVARFHLDTTAPIQSFVTEELPKSVAKLVEIPEGAEAIQPGVAALVEADALNVGETLTAYRSEKTKDGTAFIVNNLAEFRVVEKVSERLYRVQPTRILHQVELGSEFVSGGIPRGDFSPKGSPTEVAMRVLETGEETDQTFFSDPGYVFLNGGSKAGISEGQILRIRRVVAVRNPETRDGTDATIGTVKIVRVEPNYSTGVVIKSTDVVMPGDITLGSGEVR